ncbi:MAG: hypothetical protein E6H09_15110 [Bacteroidetes bacterium]|jgi:hypothetical protein|nr:MAG: hypothetical protein E6H09_15110 [Bacteroidota bacterium]
MEKFMLIFQGPVHAGQSPEKMQENMGKWMAWIDKLRKSDRYLAGEPLLPGGKLVTSKRTVTDGPYTEGKEVVGGFFIIKAKDFDEAVSICDDYPDFNHGATVQVRQIMKVEVPA